jgi:hypothetical protein
MQSRPVTARRKQTQGGFILLVIFMMAGAIALMLYAQLPRVAFESEREKEQVLIDRGEQFVRAIQLYQLDNAGQWPQSLDDLEKKGNKRYLRRRYLDPYTGKNEWRLIHTNGAQLTDSLVTKPPLAEGASPSSSSSNNTQQPQDQQVNSAVLARPSDVTLPGSQSFSAQSFPNQSNVPQFPANPTIPGPGGQAGQGGFGLPGALPTGVQLPGNVQANGAPQFPGQQPANGAFQPQFPGQQFPGQQPPPGTQSPGGFQPQFPGQQFPGQQPGTGVQTNPPAGFQFGPNGQLVPVPIGAPAPGSLPGANTAGTPGLPGGVGNAGLGIIDQLLRTPRAPPASVGQPQNNAVGGGGIAGVASTHTGPSIKTYKERTKYQEWEFVFIPQQGGVGGGGAGGQNGQNGQNNGKQNNNGKNGQQGQNNTGSNSFNTGNNSFNNNSFGTPPPTGLGTLPTNNTGKR